MSTIQMGNDEFILYIRKNYQCNIRNDQLGKRIWKWLQENANGKKLTIKACKWAKKGASVSKSGFRLPKSATQLEFSRNCLPELFIKQCRIYLHIV